MTAEAKLEEYIRRVVDAAPPLTPEQADMLRTIFRPPEEEEKPAKPKTSYEIEIERLADGIEDV